MPILEARKEQQIKNMVSILEQIDLPDILLLTRDANTLLLRQKEVEMLKSRDMIGRAAEPKKEVSEK